MSLSVRALSPQLEEVARRELNEDPARREQDLAHIREWLKKQPHIKARTDDQWLLSFLRGCKFSLEKTKEKLDTYYTMRTMLPEFYSNRDPMLPEIQELLNLGVVLPLPVLDPQGRRVVLQRLGLTNPSKVNVTTVIKVGLMIADIMLQEQDNVVIVGGVDFMDFQNITLAHGAQISPVLAKKMVTCMQDGYPFRPKAMHYINTPPLFDTVFNLFKVVMKEKLRKRLHMYGDDMESLYKQLPKTMLPIEYGGEAGSLVDLAVEWKKKIESYRDYFLKDELNKTDEKKRPGKPKTHESLFGLEGSFRQLNVD